MFWKEEVAIIGTIDNFLPVLFNQTDKLAYSTMWCAEKQRTVKYDINSQA